ncbi:MAG: PEP-CTERM sorting domain-containing protein [Limisphaerales bacterium]
MKYKAILAKTSVIVAVLGLSACGASAALTASDIAANYSGGWSTSTSPNLGSGFGAWSFLDNDGGGVAPYAGTYLDLATYGNPDTVVGGTPSSSWGVYANGAANAFIDISRAFTTDGSTASLNNQTFSVAFNSSGIGSTGQSIGLSVGSAFSLAYAGGGADNMTLSVDGGAANAISVDYAQLAAGINLALTVTGPLSSTTEGYSLVISPFAGGPALYTGTGTFDSSAYNTSSFTLAANDPSANQYFNDLSITAVPEPSSMVMLGFAGLTTLLAIRRRK